MARHVMRRSLPAALVLLVAALVPRAARAQAAGCESDLAVAPQIDPAYGADSDGDGVADADDACPSGNFSARSPECYLAAPWVPERFASRGGALGAFWTEAGCVPAMAFAIDDSPLGAGRGVVIVGAAADTARFVNAAIAANAATWGAAFTLGSRPLDGPPPSEQALCFVSFDYGAPPTSAVGVASPAIANFYVHYCPLGACDAPKTSGQLWPPDGLGLARSQSIETWRVRRPTFASDSSGIERFAFDRGVLYARDLRTIPAIGCPAAQAVAADLEDIAAFDPTRGPPRFVHALECPATAKSAPVSSTLPAGVSLLPPTLDQALRDGARARALGVLGAPPCLLEGVPYGLVADARAGSSRTAASATNGLRDSYLLATRGLLAATAAGGASSFVVVPEPIAFLDQHLVFNAASNAASSFSVTSLAPLEAVHVRQPADGRRMLSQRFEIETGASRTVETLESVDFAQPVWPPRADTFDVSERYGARWTSNDGPPDCWATTALAEAGDAWLRFSYPIASGASGQLAADFCPNELDGWLVRTKAVRESPEALCAQAELATDQSKLELTVLEAASRCVANAGSSDAGVANAGKEARAGEVASCLRSGCDPLTPGSCPDNPGCARLLRQLTSPTPEVEQCIADAVLSGTETALPASAHWADVVDGDKLRLVAMVGLMRTTDVESERVLPATRPDGGLQAGAGVGETGLSSTISHMTGGDDFVGGAHQTLDWNFIVKSDQTDAIDPAYRGIAVRGDRFIGVENELEMGVPSAMWSAHVRLLSGHGFNTHGLEFAAFLQSKDTAAGLGEIWPSDFCSAFGIDRGIDSTGRIRPSIPATDCQPCVSCAASDAGVEAGCHPGRRYFRAHLGRGLFSPISPETVISSAAPETAFMAASPDWPGCPAGKAKKPKDILPLGLEDWHACPHRIAYLGRPIIDCGHGDEACEPGFRLEIHPPHVISMELHAKTLSSDGASCTTTDPCSVAAPVMGCTPGVVQGVFGWANVLAGRHLEFDLWPPARPAPDSKLCVVGHDNDQSAATPAAQALAVVDGLGFRVVRPPEGPPCGPTTPKGPPQLHCTPVPIADPNHVHCAYEDPSAESCSDPDAKKVEGSWTYGNPRMTPRFATSLFEARIFTGWGSATDPCPVCAGGDECAD